MRQLNVFCEGQAEQGFCAQVLQPHLFAPGTGIVHTLAVGEKDHHHLYGIGRQTKYERVRKFIVNTIQQRQGKIDDGKGTAPSKRIIGILPEYDGRKSTAGPDIVEFIGVAKIRVACPHFHRWLVRLEGIPWEEE